MRKHALEIAVALPIMLLAASGFAQDDGSPMRERGVEEPTARTERDPDRLGWYVPDFARLQTGGFVGMVAIGIGYAAFDDVLNLSAHYGFTPAAHAGSDVHAFSFEVLVRPLDFKVDDFRIVPIYAGPGLLYAWGDEFFTALPERYSQRDSSYYPPTSLHWTLRAGIELDYLPASGFIERHGAYYEVTLLDTYLDRYRENPDSLGLEEVFAGAVGYRAAF